MESSSTGPLPHRYGFPRTETLGDVDLRLRLMEADDVDAMLAFTRSLPERDLLFMRIDITSRKVVEGWVDNVLEQKTVTVIGEENGQIVGYSSLHHSEILWTRHLGEMRLLVGSAFRGKGIGRQLAEAAFGIARELKLFKLVAQMMTTQRSAQNLFHHLGFIPEAQLHDWVMDRKGHTHDLILMSREVDSPDT